jgi:hypothetical protein
VRWGSESTGLLIFSTRLLFGSNLIYRKTIPTIPSGASTLAATCPILLALRLRLIPTAPTTRGCQPRGSRADRSYEEQIVVACGEKRNLNEPVGGAPFASQGCGFSLPSSMCAQSQCCTKRPVLMRATPSKITLLFPMSRRDGLLRPLTHLPALSIDQSCGLPKNRYSLVARKYLI